MFLAGKRKLTLKQVKRLSERFRLPADVLMREASGLREVAQLQAD